MEPLVGRLLHKQHSAVPNTVVKAMVGSVAMAGQPVGLAHRYLWLSLDSEIGIIAAMERNAKKNIYKHNL